MVEPSDAYPTGTAATDVCQKSPSLPTDQRKPALISAWLGQAFDAMNTMMFFMIMYPALSDLLHRKDATNIDWHSGIIIAIFTVGWAIGSVLFWLLADRIGRAKTFLPASRFTRLHLDSVPSRLNGWTSPFTAFLWE
jgi:hypothetical protein